MVTNLFAWRYFKAKKNTNAINVISWISVVAIMVVTAALVVVLSVFNGFENLVKDLYSDFYSDISITTKQGKWFTVSPGQLDSLKAIDGVRSVQQVAEERAILMDEDQKSIVWLKGVPDDYGNTSGVASHMASGRFVLGDSSQPGLVLGVGVETALQILADRSIFPVTVYLPNRFATNPTDPMESLHSANVHPTGSFIIQQEFDNNYAFTNLDFLRYMLDLQPGEVSKLELQTTGSVSAISSRVKRVMGDDFNVQTRFQQNQALFAAMQMEKLIIFAVAFLILLIAAFNIMSTLTMMVLEKQKDIAILNAMGTTPRQIRMIFVKLGLVLGFVGAVAGFIIGVLICLGQQKYHWVKLGGNSFIIDHYPVAMRAGDFLVIAVIIIAITVLAAIIPTGKVKQFANHSQLSY